MGNMRISVAVVGVLVAGVALSGCSGSSNLTACKLYEDGYNQMADVVRLKGEGVLTADDVLAQMDMLPSRFADAYDQATGDVAVLMRASVESATAANLDLSNQDVGVASLLDMTAVAEACAADGAAIVLNEFE